MTQLAFLRTEQLRIEPEPSQAKGFALGERDLWTRDVGAIVEDGLSVRADGCTDPSRDRVDTLGI